MQCLMNRCMQKSYQGNTSSLYEDSDGSKVLKLENSNASDEASYFYPYNRNVAGLFFLKMEPTNFTV